MVVSQIRVPFLPPPPPPDRETARIMVAGTVGSVGLDLLRISWFLGLVPLKWMEYGLGYILE